MTVLDGTVTVTELVAAVRRQQDSRPIAPIPATQPQRSVCIVAAHPGAGATAVAVAIVDALAASGREVTLLDGADSPDAFGAVEVEIDSGTPGLRVGRRGLVTVVRRDAGALDTTPGESVIVIDGDIGTCVHRAIVCRPTLPSTGKAERLLTDGSLLAVVGASRWPPAVHASLGPAAKGATDGNRVVFFPHHRGVEIRGVDAEPTPMSLLKGGSRLVELIWPHLVAPDCRRWKGPRR